MAKVAPIRGEWPELFIRIETDGRLDLGNVGRFLQRLNTAVRSTRPQGAPVPRVEIVSLEGGSILLRIAALSLLVASGQLAFQIFDYFQTNESAARVGRDLIQADNATTITIVGGENSFEISPKDIPRLNETLVAAAESRGVLRASRPQTLIEGPATGFAKRIDGEWWIELDRRKGMKLVLFDQRVSKEPLRENVRYRFEGDMFIGSDGEPSGYSIYSAMPLG